MVQGRARRGGRKSLKCNFKDIQGFKCTPSSTIFPRILARRGWWGQFPTNHALSRVYNVPVNQRSSFLLELLLQEDVGVIDDTFTKELKGSQVLLHLTEKCVLIIKKHKKVLSRKVYTSKKQYIKKIMNWRDIYTQVRKDLSVVFPKLLLGSEANWTVVWSKLRSLLERGTKGVLQVDSLMKGVRQSEIPWLQTLRINGHRQRIIAKILRFMVGWVLAYVSSFWHVADTSGGLKFFDKRYWQHLEDRTYNDAIKSGKLAIINNSTDDYQIIAKLRFVPKGDKAVRPLAVVKRQNDFLANVNVRAFLNSILREYPWKYGHWGHLQDVITVLQKLQTAKRTGEISMVYYVQTDIDDAFGSIVHNKLQSILEKIFRTVIPDDLHVLEFKYLKHSSAGFFRDVFKYKFRKPMKPLEGCKQRPLRKKKNVREIIEFLKEVPKVALEFKKRNHVLTQGVDQGVMFSSFLCEVYFREMVEIHLLEFVKQRHEYLLRFADDILYITPHQDRAKMFFEATINGFPEMNCRFKVAKTITNVDGTLDLPICCYLGGIINFQTLTLTPSFQESEKRINCVKYNVIERRFEALRSKEILPICGKLSLARNDPWFMDLSVNGTDVVLKTVESSAKHTAEKLAKAASLLWVTSAPRPKLVMVTIVQFCRRFVKSCRNIYKQRFPKLEKQILDEDLELAVLKSVFKVTSPLEMLKRVNAALVKKIKEVQRQLRSVRKGQYSYICQSKTIVRK